MRMARHAVMAAVAAAVCCGALAAPFRDGDRVVFLGDSITHAGLYHTYLFEYCLTRYPHAKIDFRNAGIAGDEAHKAKARFARDVAAHNPTAVSVMFGMNDIGRHLYGPEQNERTVSERRERMKRIAGYLAELDRLMAGAGVRDVYRLTPTPYEDTAVIETATRRRFSGCNAALGQVASIVRKRAAENGGTLVDLYTALNAYNREKQAKDPAFSIVGKDRVHPQEAGHLLMAYVFLKTQGADGVVSDVGLDFGRRELEKSVKAKVDGIVWGDDSVEFTVLEESLPMHIDPKARPVLEDVPFVRDLNQQIVQVRSLPRGRWALEIDGERVGAWFSAEWERGINIAMNEKTPQYKQAKQVHQAVMERKAVEERLVQWKACKWWLDANGVDSDDWKAVEKFWNAKPDRKGYFENFYADFRENWDRREEQEMRIAEATERCRAAAKPVKRRYRIFR